MAHGGRNQHIDGGNRLQGQGAHFQIGRMEGALHGVDDLPRQEGGNDYGFGFFAPLANQHLELDIVQNVADGAVAHAVVTAGVVHGM